MQYNYDFEIASLIIMMIILLHFLFIRQFPSEKTRIFGMLLFACIFECGFNIASSVGLANATFVPQGVNEWLAFAFFSFEGLTSYLIFRYFMVAGQIEDRKQRRVIWLVGIIPFLIFEAFLVATPFTGFFYYFEDGTYHQGFGSNFGYMYISFYFIMNIVLVLSRRRIVGTRTKMILLLYTLFAVSAITIQFYYRNILLTSIGNATILIMTYLAMQNPHELLDPVTGIGNEQALTLQLKNRIVSGKEVAIITIEVRKFHYISTTLGIENSNVIMAEIGRYLYGLCGKFHVFHNSGAFFSVLVDDAEQSRGVQEAILSRFREGWAAKENHIVLNMDMVVQHYPKDFESIPEYLGMRNFLLEEAGRMGNLAVVELDESFIEKYHRRTKVEMAVSRAIQEKTFQVYYQPIYSLKEKRIVSLEALLRLSDEELGFIPPDEFIPLAERDGNIGHIEAIVLEECCKFLSRHVLSNVSLGIRTIHINVSAAQCLRQNLTEIIAPVLQQYHIPPSMITLEITERTAISTPEQMQIHMRELGEMGVTFAMDDYGSGNSNCSYLIRFPFQEVKIDKEIVWAYFENQTAQAVLEQEIQTIRRLGILIVAEGVEKGEQSEQMERLGVDLIQGYYYGKPMPEKECLRYIRNFNAMPEEYGRNGF